MRVSSCWVQRLPAVLMWTMMWIIMWHMKTVQMTLDEALVTAVDKAVRRMKTTRSAFAREALRTALATLATRELDRRHREGYLKKPAKRGEFDVWEKEHAWGDQ